MGVLRAVLTLNLLATRGMVVLGFLLGAEY
jgi:hypothetical protein